MRVFNDIASTIGKGNGNLLVLLDLSAAFDTIDCLILFDILKMYIGFDGNALKLIMSYFSDCTQRVQIDDGILSEFASIVCRVPQGSVLGPLKFCVYMLPLSVILRLYKIGYHVYADDTQIYVSFKCDDPSQAHDKINVCISDIGRWMILNKLKINHAKTEFIVFRSPMLKHDLSDMSVNVGGNLIKPSVKVMYHISAALYLSVSSLSYQE